MFHRLAFTYYLRHPALSLLNKYAYLKGCHIMKVEDEYTSMI